MQAIAEAILAPQRFQYSAMELGPQDFLLEGKEYHRSDFEVTNGRGLRLKASFFAGERAAAPCVVYCHGNCGNRLDSLEVLEAVLPRGLTFCAFDFSAAGHSEGEYVSFGYFEQQDIAAVLQCLVEAGEANEFILWGRSMGAAASILYASSHPEIKAVVADSSFMSLRQLLMDVVNSYIPLPNFLSSFLVSRLGNAIKAKAGFDIECLLHSDIDVLKAAVHSCAPFVFVHSVEDTLIHAKHSRALYHLTKDRAALIEVTGAHTAVRPLAIITRILETAEKAAGISDDTSCSVQEAVPSEAKEFKVREKLTHYRNRTEMHSGSYSEQAFRSALSELADVKISGY